MLQSVDPSQRRTGWVLQMLGKAYLELADYKQVRCVLRCACSSSCLYCLQARSAFRGMWRVAPHRLHGVEAYSTALWHLKDEVRPAPRLLFVSFVPHTCHVGRAVPRCAACRACQ